MGLAKGIGGEDLGRKGLPHEESAGLEEKKATVGKAKT